MRTFRRRHKFTLRERLDGKFNRWESRKASSLGFDISETGDYEVQVVTAVYPRRADAFKEVGNGEG